MESNSYSFFIMLTVVIGVCYCFYKVCEVFMYCMSLKYGKPLERNKDNKPKIDIKVGDVVDENKNNTETLTETDKE